jgi:hypothetical protein
VTTTRSQDRRFLTRKTISCGLRGPRSLFRLLAPSGPSVLLYVGVAGLLVLRCLLPATLGRIVRICR